MEGFFLERRFDLGRIIISAVALLLVALFLLMIFNDSKLQNFLHPDIRQESEYDHEQEENITRNIAKVQSSIDKNLGSIVLYSDEYGHNGVLADKLHTIINNDLFSQLNIQLQNYPRILGQTLDIPVSNFEIHGESFETMLARIGVETIFTAQRFVMPASGDEQVDIRLKTISDTPVVFSNQKYTSLGEVTVNHITGQLSRPIAEEEESDENVYIFRRSESGEEMKILSGAKVTFESSEKYRDSLPVIFFGKNDFSGARKYIDSLSAIIERHNDNDKYIVICRIPANTELDEQLEKTFGTNYIRIDDEIDYSDLAEKIYYRMKTLKYLDIIQSSVQKAEKRILPQE